MYAEEGEPGNNALLHVYVYSFRLNHTDKGLHEACAV